MLLSYMEGKKRYKETLFYLQGFLQDSNREIPDGIGRDPQTETRVGFRDPLQGLLQLLEPLHQQMAILEH